MGKLAMGKLEAAIMEILWNQQEPLTPGQVHALLAEQHSVTYSTVLTILIRLWNKGRLERRKEGRAFTYWPSVGRQEYVAARMKEALAAASNRPEALGYFVGALTPADQERLRKILEEN
jgi:predicted transcriptional regulator